MTDEITRVEKPDGRIQREDISLSAAIALSLRQRILDGLSVYPKKGKTLELEIEEGGEKKTVTLTFSTISNWVVRENVIPETGIVFREYLDEAREEKRKNDDLAEQADIIDVAQKGLQAIVKLPTTGGKIITKKYKVSKTGKETQYSKSVTEFEGHNPKLVETKSRALMFALERLKPGVYAQKTDNRHMHMVFSLSDLRKAKEARDQRIALQMS